MAATSRRRLRPLEMPIATDTKRRLSKLITVRIVHPLARFALGAARVPGTALLETTGRRSGQPRRVPVGDGLRGEAFWIVAEHGRRADYVRNLQADPRVRVKVGRRWLSGTAHVLPDDDPRDRL